MPRALPDPCAPEAGEPPRRPDHPRGGSARPRPAAGVTSGVAGRVPVAALLLAGWCGVAVGISLSDGRYSPLALISVLLGAAAVAGSAVVTRGSTGPVARRVTGAALALCAAVVLVGPLVRHPRYYATGPAAAAADVLAAAAGVLAGSALLGAARPLCRRARPAPRHPAGERPAWWTRGWVFWTVLVLAVAAGAATVVAAPQPRIDVFHLLQVSTAGLADGENMYRQQWGADRATYSATAGGLFDVYPYLPGTSLLLAPFRWLLGDVRYGLLLALALAAVAARAVGRAGGDPEVASVAGGLLPLLLVVFPESMYALQQSWTEPLLVLLLAVTVQATLTGRGRLALVAFALALASKQHVALLIPLAACWPQFGLRRTLASAGLAVAIVAPWLAAAPRDFLDDAVRTNLGYQVLDHSLSVPGWAHHFGVTLGFGPAAVVLGASYLLAWRLRGGAAGFCAGSALVLLALNLMNKQTFFNHYTLPMALLVLAVCAAAPARCAPPCPPCPPGRPGRPGRP